MRMHRECRERFPRHCWLAIPTYITARASRTCRDACRNRKLAVSFEIGGGENVPGIPGACATRNFVYLARGPWRRSDTVLLCLFHCGLVTPYDIVDMDHHWTWWWVAACSAPKHYLTHCWHIVNWIRRNRRFWSKYNDFHSRICTWKGRLLNVGHFIHATLW